MDDDLMAVHEPFKFLHDEKRGLIVSVYKTDGHGSKEIAAEHLEELRLLAETFGVHIVHQLVCPIRRYDASTSVTEGKLKELVELSKQYHANLVIFDDEIAPSQQRNLEKAFGLPVIDRTEVILGVFAERAKTKEARLQIQLAQVKYQAPRLKRLWTHLSRQHGSGGGGSGGGGYTKGEGEKQIEIDRRILKRRIEMLEKELEGVQAIREVQRHSRKRSEIPVFAIIGYTNAGKSTLLNALTAAGVFVENKLFATLDTTTRKFTLLNNQDILLIDTVGFIRKLPHLLVAAFRSTLEEAFEADILLHLVDVSHPMAEEQAETAFHVLKELNVKDKPIITVLNKIDLLTSDLMLSKFRLKYPNLVALSALNAKGFDELQEAMIKELSKRRRVISMRIAQCEYHVVSEVIRLGNVISQDYEGNDVLLKVDIPAFIAERLSKYVEKDSS